MNVLQIKIHEDGTLDCNPDFKIIRGGYRNILMNVEVPHTLLLAPIKDEVTNQNVTGNFVRVAAVIRTVVGKNIQTQKYGLEPIKDFEINGKMYRLYQRLMPKEFTMWETVNQSERFGSGKLQLIFNVVNWSMENGENIYSQTTKIEKVVSSPILTLDVFTGGFLEDTDAIDNPKDYEILKERVDGVENGLNNANNDIKALQDKDIEIDADIKNLQDRDNEIVADTTRQIQTVQEKAEEDIENLRNEVNEKPYFYGWYNSYDDLVANFPTATENDYAYIIGGNIYEYHNNQWVDTGNKTPDNIAPLSDDDPMPVGDIASPGTSSKAAKGDHVHKENEKTRADINKNTADIANNTLSIDNKLDKSQLVQETGQSTTDIMSQKIVTDRLNEKFDKTGGVISGNTQMNGRLDVNVLNAYGSLDASSIELRGAVATPYIDWHYNNSSNDHDMRMMLTAVDKLSISGGTVDFENITRQGVNLLDSSKIKTANTVFTFTAGANTVKNIYNWTAQDDGFVVLHFSTWHSGERVIKVVIAQNDAGANVPSVSCTSTSADAPVNAGPLGTTYVGKVQKGSVIKIYTTTNSAWNGTNTGFLKTIFIGITA